MLSVFCINISLGKKILQQAFIVNSYFRHHCQDNARLFSVRKLKNLFKYHDFDLTSYSSYLAQIDIHQFTLLKKWLGQSFCEDRELQNAAKDWLRSQATEFQEEGICKIFKYYEKRLKLCGDYVGKYGKAVDSRST